MTEAKKRIRMKITMEQARIEIGRIEHAKCQSGMPRYWIAEQDESDNDCVTIQSICWLFCWAKTGQNSDDARRQARRAFDAIFDPPFEWLSQRLNHNLARRWRYSTEDITDVFYSHIERNDARKGPAD